MNNTGPEDTLQASEAVRPILIAYLAGTLSPDQRDRFEFRMLEDDSFSRSVEEAEFSLVEDFAADALQPSERAVIGPWIQTSVARRAQVEIAQTLRKRQQGAVRSQQRANVVAFERPQMMAAAAPQPNARVVPFQAAAAKKRVLPWRFAVPLAMAAALAVSVYVVKEHGGGSNSANNKPDTHQQQPPVVTGQPTAGPGAANGLHDADNIQLQVKRLGVFGKSSAPPTFDVRSGHPVHLQIAVPRALAGQSYSLELRSAGHPDLDESHLVPNTGVVPPVVEFTVPAGAFEPGHYEGELKSPLVSFPLSFNVEMH